MGWVCVPVEEQTFAPRRAGHAGDKRPVDGCTTAFGGRPRRGASKSRRGGAARETGASRSAQLLVAAGAVSPFPPISTPRWPCPSFPLRRRVDHSPLTCLE